MKVFRHPLFYFSIMIFSFTFLYWSFWFYYPDSFVKNDYLNSTPRENASRIAYGVNPEIHDGRYFSQSNIYNESDNLVSSHNEIILRDLRLHNELSKVSLEENILLKQNEALSSVNYNQYINDSANNLKKELMSLLVENKHEPQREVAIAELNLKIAIKIKEANDYAFEHRAEFNDLEVWKKIQEKDSVKNKIRKEIDDNDRKRTELQLKAESFLVNSKRPDITLMDFFFYSVGISTTTTFGDIMASSRGARGMVTIQLLISIFILAFATTKFVNGLQRKSE
ncbi:hypothetical protein FD737_12890 [Pantoea sp. Seng]|uniref:ion channel n=1 Tax=Pantoea sp. Seng TaxID=2576761 RepID=UPI0013272213|nr:ion channel [Pantoea sp. Seng]MXP53974.1 hypothetical protein [Pantoea sp. Seng]